MTTAKEQGYTPGIINAITKKKKFTKTLTWRILATSDTFLISYLITGRFDFAGAIAGIEVITKMFLYYMHERVG